MPTRPGAVICLGCGFNIETGSEAATRIKERRVREPIGVPSSARLAAGAGLSCAGAAVALGVWAALATVTGRPWYSMAAFVGVCAGVGMLFAVRGSGRISSGLIAAGPGLIAAAAGLALFAPEPTEPFPNPFLAAFDGSFQGFLGVDLSMVGVMGEDEAVLAGGVWFALAGVAAFAFGRSNPDEDAEEDDAAAGEGGAGG